MYHLAWHLSWAIPCFIILLAIAFRCKHSWEFVDKTELTSRMEELMKAGVTSGYLWPSQVESMCTRYVIIVIRCPKCGKSKVIKEGN
jgi:hypothetical protein